MLRYNTRYIVRYIMRYKPRYIWRYTCCYILHYNTRCLQHFAFLHIPGSVFRRRVFHNCFVRAFRFLLFLFQFSALRHTEACLFPNPLLPGFVFRRQAFRCFLPAAGELQQTAGKGEPAQRLQPGHGLFHQRHGEMETGSDFRNGHGHAGDQADSVVRPRGGNGFHAVPYAQHGGSFRIFHHNGGNVQQIVCDLRVLVLHKLV